MKKVFNIACFCIWVLSALEGTIRCTSCHEADQSGIPKQYGGEYRVPLENEPPTLDPALFTDIYAMNVAANLFDGLVEFDDHLGVAPAIANKWKISRDYRTYTFHLRKGVRFHNGREVTADDFVFSFTRILSPETKSPAASLFLNIRGAKAFHEGKSSTVTGLTASDSHILIIELEEPFAPFLSILAMINAKVVPKEAMDPDFGKHPVGTGPFRFRSWEPAKEIVLEANKDYFADRPFLNFLRFPIYPNADWDKVFSDFEKGILEQAFIPTNKYDLIASNIKYKDRYTLITVPGINLIYVGMNMTLEPFKDPRVRRAFIHAVDRERIVKEITRRGNVPAKGILPSGIAGFDPHLQTYPYDPQRAQKLLKEAGYPQGRGIPPLEIWTGSKAESVQEELKAYQQYLAQVGITIIPRVAPTWKEFMRLINEKKAPLFYAAWYADFPDPDNFLYVLCHSQSKTNRTGYTNPQVDVLLEQARREMNYMKRAELYGKVERIVMEDAPVICQHVNSYNYLFQPWVKGVELSHLGAIYIPFRKVWIDSGRLPKEAKS